MTRFTLGTPRLIWLYLRARLAGSTMAGLVLVTAAGWASVRRYGDDPTVLSIALTLFPLAAACLVGVSSHGPFGEAERTASRHLARYRLGHLGGLALLGAGLLAGAADGWLVADARWLVVRNLTGFTGLALLTAFVLGGRLSWVVPVAFGLATLAIAPRGALDAAPPTRWAWPGWPGADGRATLIALTLSTAGLLLVAIRGAHSEAETTV